jgi:hypothetical protein
MATGLNGFPSVSGISVSSIATGALGRLEAAIWDLLSVSPKWGIYLDNTVAIEVDSVLSVEHRAFAQVPTYRLMSGAFASYNKISMPSGHRIVLAVGGDQTRREFFVAWLETQREAATVFDVVTPEKTYKRVTLTEYSVRRTAESGTASRIIAECTFEEIREALTTYYVAGEDTADTTNASDAADTPTSETGFVQTITYTAKTAMESVTAYVSGVVENVSNTISNITGS